MGSVFTMAVACMGHCVFQNFTGFDKKRAKGEFFRLALSVLWMLSAALLMALVQINGDSMQASRLKRIQTGGAANNVMDRIFISLPKIPDGSLWNPDIALHSFIVISLVACFVHWPFLTAIARLRRYMWLFGFGYFLRMFCLAGTIMPPSNPTCVPVERGLIESILMTPALLFGFIHTCTDKIFSGHTIVATLLMWSWIDARAAVSDPWYSPWYIYPVAHTIFMILTSIMGWNHYTVDIIVSLFINTLNYWMYRSLLYIYQIYGRKAPDGSYTHLAPLPSRFIAWLDGADLDPSLSAAPVGETSEIV